MPSSTRIALFIPNFEAGGAERVMIRLAQGLAALGHDVDLLVLSERGPFRKEVPPEVNVVSFNVTRAIFGIVPLIGYLRRKSPDVLLSAIFHANFVAALACSLSGRNTRLVVSEHNTLGLVRSAVNPLQWKVFLLALKAAYPRADTVVCVSQGIASGLLTLMPKLGAKVVVIGNPVVTDEVLSMGGAQVEHPWLVQTSPKLVLAVGRLIRAKGFDLLIEAFAKIHPECNANLLILGEGPERQALQALIDERGLNEHVCLYGFTENPYAWMSQADLFVLSSRHEGLPGALIEAMACGCKVVSTDCPFGPSEILEQGKWGHLVPVEDSVALARAILEGLQTDDFPDVRHRARAFHLSRVVHEYEMAILGEAN